MANVPISAFTVPANTVGIGATGYSLTGSASASFMDLAGTWNTSGTPTLIKAYVTDTGSNAASLLLDLGTTALGSRFNVAKGGSLALAGDMTVGSATGGNSFVLLDTTGVRVSALRGLGFASGNSAGNTLDLFLTRRGAANLRLGAADAATPVAQTLSVQGRTGTDAAATAYPFTIQGAQGTGTGAGGSIVFQVAPAGTAGSTPNGFATALTINSSSQLLFAGSANAGLFKQSASDFIEAITGFSMAAGGSNGCSMQQGGFFVGSGATIGFTAGNGIATRDTILARDAANTLALRNATAAQTFNVYGTFTDASNYERLAIKASTSGIQFVSERAGSGSARYMQFTTGGGAYLDVVEGVGLNFRSSAGTSYWQMNTSGHFLAATDNTYDIGASGATRPRSIFTGTNLVVNAGHIFTAGGTTRLTFGTGSAAGSSTVTFDPDNSRLSVRSGWVIGWSSSATDVINNSPDTTLVREAAAVTGVRGAAGAGGALSFVEQTAPAAPAANGVRIYAVDNGSGKTQLMALFATGAAQQIAIEP
jgi:hypothetical protein